MQLRSRREILDHRHQLQTARSELKAAVAAVAGRVSDVSAARTKSEALLGGLQSTHSPKATLQRVLTLGSPRASGTWEGALVGMVLGLRRAAVSFAELSARGGWTGAPLSTVGLVEKTLDGQDVVALTRVQKVAALAEIAEPGRFGIRSRSGRGFISGLPWLNEGEGRMSYASITADTPEEAIDKAFEVMTSGEHFLSSSDGDRNYLWNGTNFEPLEHPGLRTERFAKPLGDFTPLLPSYRLEGKANAFTGFLVSEPREMTLNMRVVSQDKDTLRIELGQDGEAPLKVDLSRKCFGRSETYQGQLEDGTGDLSVKIDENQMSISLTRMLGGVVWFNATVPHEIPVSAG